MKEFVFSLIILLIVIAFVIFNSVFMQRITSKGVEILESVIEGKADFSEFTDYFEKHTVYIGLVSRFGDIISVHSGIDTVRVMLEENGIYPDYELNYRLCELKRNFARLSQNEDFSFANLF